jgi:hypothetical protein
MGLTLTRSVDPREAVSQCAALPEAWGCTTQRDTGQAPGVRQRIARRAHQRARGSNYCSASGAFFSVMTGNCGAISAFSSMNGFWSSGTLS